jgi:hypothetical protein
MSAGRRGQVGRELPVPVAEHRAQRPGQHRRLDDIGDQRAPGDRGRELVRVPPPQRVAERRPEDAGELARRVVGCRVMAGHPAQPAGQFQYCLPVADRRRLPRHAHWLPWRRQARDGPRPGVPGEYLVRPCGHHT